MLRDKIGYVPQKGVLFSGDIASNILFGNPDGGEAVMKEAAQIAQAEEFIEAKSEKYHSHIAQGGSNVSGGQKQRLSIARAIAKHPELFIFDDSFSALDYKTDVILSIERKDKRQYGFDSGAANQYDPACRSDHCAGRGTSCRNRNTQRTSGKL